MRPTYSDRREPVNGEIHVLTASGDTMQLPARIGTRTIRTRSHEALRFDRVPVAGQWCGNYRLLGFRLYGQPWQNLGW